MNATEKDREVARAVARSILPIHDLTPPERAVNEDGATEAIATAIAAARAEEPEWQDISTAPKDGTRFWGHVGDNAIAMFWHEQFEAFVSSFRRMTMAPGYTVNGKPYEDHSPTEHRPTEWMPLPRSAGEGHPTKVEG